MVPSSAQRSARPTRSVPGDRGAPIPAVAVSARTAPEVRCGSASQNPGVALGAVGCPPAGCPPAECSALQAERGHALSPGAAGRAWTCAASTRSVPGATSAAATDAATSAHGCLVVRGPRATEPGLAPGHAGCQPDLREGHSPQHAPGSASPQGRFLLLPITLLPAEMRFRGEGTRRDVERDEALARAGCTQLQLWLPVPCPRSLGAP